MKFKEFLKEDPQADWFDSFTVIFMEGPYKDVEVKSWAQMQDVIDELDSTGKFTDPQTHVQHRPRRIAVFANKTATFSWPFKIKDEVMKEVFTIKIGDLTDPKITIKDFKDFPTGVDRVELQHCSIESFNGIKQMDALRTFVLEKSTFKNIVGFIDASPNARFESSNDELSQSEHEKMRDLQSTIQQAQKAGMDKAEFVELLHDKNLEEFI